MSLVLGFEDIDRTQVALVGGKAAHLGELARMDGISVPPGFCVTTEAFALVVAATPQLHDRLEHLSRLAPTDRDMIRTVSAEIRTLLEQAPVPADVEAAIRCGLAELGGSTACAVRSSATAEDLPTTSFAGQHDSYLDVIAAPAVLRHVSRCWASLFTERAVAYRLRNDVDHRRVRMAVVVQRMVPADAAGVLFTADPITSNRTVAVIEAVRGLGEALVAGSVDADACTVVGGVVRQLRSVGGQPVLSVTQALRLAALGRRVEAQLGSPQDIEWCLLAEDFHLVQSRPITTLFPIPSAPDGQNHVYVSVGHQQMMTDPFTPLGLSFWQITTPRPMAEAGGRLFVDVTAALAAPASRAALIDALGTSDPLIGDALQTVADRAGFLPPPPDDVPAWTPPGSGSEAIATDPAIVDELIADLSAHIAATERSLRGRSGSDLLEVIAADIAELKRAQFGPRGLQVIMAGMQAATWLNTHLRDWLGETNVADTLAQSVPHNVTAEMGLALLDVADVVRAHPAVVAFLSDVQDDTFLDELAWIEGGPAVRDALSAFLATYGMRCAGEIDIARPRWSEQPSTLVPLILGNVRNFGPDAGAHRFERGLQEAHAKAAQVLDRLRALPDGTSKAEETQRMIERLRTFTGYREYPKYGMVSRYFLYKQALLGEADRLVRAGTLAAVEDVFFLRFEELQDVVRTGRVDRALIVGRRQALATYRALTPPRVSTSDGEAVAGTYRRDDVPAGALVGLAVSTGTVEGRARIVTDMARADLETGDILVTAFTDPSWTPLFVAIAGLVTEVGGLMTHGAVIAREYGLPAVVGVANATGSIRDGQRIRVHGTEGYVEILS